MINLDNVTNTKTYNDDCEILDLCGINPNSSSSSNSSTTVQFATVNEKGILKLYDTGSSAMKK